MQLIVLKQIIRLELLAILFQVSRELQHDRSFRILYDEVSNFVNRELGLILWQFLFWKNKNLNHGLEMERK